MCLRSKYSFIIYDMLSYLSKSQYFGLMFAPSMGMECWGVGGWLGKGLDGAAAWGNNMWRRRRRRQSVSDWLDLWIWFNQCGRGVGVGRQEYTFSISVINRIIYWSYGIHTYGHMNMYVYTYMVYDCICCILETMMIYFISWCTFFSRWCKSTSGRSYSGWVAC